jgi:ABC-2 type transport system permease protein
MTANMATDVKPNVLSDVRAVMWKERRGILRVRGSRGRLLLTMLSPLLLATFLPYQWGPEWVSQVPPLVLAFIVPAILVGLTVPESFAGERERHTLQTLLASRLPDRAILWGKLAISLLFGWGVALLMLLVSLVVLNIAYWDGQLLLYTMPIGLGSLALSFLSASLVGGLGVLMSMRSETVQEAAQKLMGFILVPPILLQVVFFAFRERMGQIIESINGPQALAIVLGVMLVLDVVIMLLAMRSFKRSRLALL